MILAVHVPELILASVGVLATGGGLWPAHLYRRSRRLETAAARRQFYAAQWAISTVAAPASP